jgi:ABC-type branched-subunit amino acid transport system substrate-binding protein
VPQRGGAVAAVELYDPNTADFGPSARRLAAAAGGAERVAILVPVAPPRLSGVLAALGTAGLDSKTAQYLGTGVWDVPSIGADAAARGGWYAAPDPAARADFERRFTATYGKPPNRLATLAYDAVALAASLARLKPGGDFSAEAIASPNGWSGVDGAFRFLPNGRSERALAVIEVQSNRGVVVSPAPSGFVRPSL